MHVSRGKPVKAILDVIRDGVGLHDFIQFVSNDACEVIDICINADRVAMAR